VNAVCFADESSTNILVSGADDGYVKVWDRRSLSSSTPSGVLVGATEGITYTAPKGDGRYIVANSKDQAARLYDLRKMRSHSEFEREPDAVARYGQPRFDCESLVQALELMSDRSMRYPPPRGQRLAHPKDCSVMTYRGHQVLKTLIRCHFSPRESTGQSYIYSGR
jgi:WD repeat-containing protein 23